MALLLSSPAMAPPKTLALSTPQRKNRFIATTRSVTPFHVGAFFKPIEDQPILKDAIKEPLAFMGGIFAGLLRLDLNEDPLREWIARTVDASGMSADEAGARDEDGGGSGDHDAPQQIVIE